MFPGVTDTSWWDRQPAELKQRVFERVAATVSVRRIGYADDVADTIVFLIGNGYMTGVILDVDGGMRGAEPYWRGTLFKQQFPCIAWGRPLPFTPPPEAVIPLTASSCRSCDVDSAEFASKSRQSVLHPLQTSDRPI